MPIGLIAGNSAFPFLVLRAARQMGHAVTVVAIEGEAFPALEALAEELGGTTFRWVPLGQLQACITALRETGVSRAVMAGQVRHVKMFSEVQPDPLMASVLRSLGAANTDALISGVAGALVAQGITLMDSTAFLAELMARAGVLTSRTPSAEMQNDFDFGYGVADAVAGLDIGQTIVVKNRAVVAVEAMEGTDATIQRAGALAGRGARVVKVAKPAQDMRFDVPVVGVATVTAMEAAGVDGLSIDAGKTLVLDGEAFVRAADAAGIVVVGRARP
jgi:DUF1009 family protein